MQPTAVGLAVKAHCPDCGGAISLFDWRDSSREFGYVLLETRHDFKSKSYTRIHYRLLRCSGCSRAGLAKFHDNGQGDIAFESFYPRALTLAPLPPTVPDGISAEYKEAALCASVEAWRGASALLRSTLEKALKANGYVKGTLQARIDDAASDGVITAARSQKAHDDIRVLGNEVVHDDWRAVDEAEVEAALHYTQRILEDLYDDRTSVEKLLIAKGRLPKP